MTLKTSSWFSDPAYLSCALTQAVRLACWFLADKMTWQGACLGYCLTIMKRRIAPLAVLAVGACFVVLNGFSRPAASPAPGNEAVLEKEAVSKVFAAHHFTPPMALAGPSGLTWYVGARPVNGPVSVQSVQQMMVGVRRGASFTVEFKSFRRDREDAPWVAPTTSEAATSGLERAIRDQLQKELALEEKAK